MSIALEALLLDHSNGILLLVDASSLAIVEASKPSLRLLGYRREDLLGRPITDIECALADELFWEEVRQGSSIAAHTAEGSYRCAGGDILLASKTVSRVTAGGEAWMVVRAEPLDSARGIEDELDAIPSLLRSTLEATADGILLIDRAGRIVNMNQRFSRIWGLPDELLLEHEDSAILAFMAELISDPDAYRARLAQIAPDSSDETFDLLHLADGRYFERKSLPAKQGARILGRVFSFTDITARKRMEEEYRTVIHASTDGFWITDFSGRILDVNEAICQMLGYARDELLRMSVSDVEAEESPEAIVARIRRMSPAGSAQFQGRHRRKDGRVIDVELSALCVAALGERYFVFVRDITQRRLAEEELTKSIAFRELLLEAMPLPIFYKDVSGRYAGCNSAFARFVGKPMRDIVGKTVFELSRHSFAQTYRDKDLDLLDDPLGVQTYESQVAHADGTTHDVIFHKARMVDALGRATGILGVITDISEIKRIEAARDHLEAQLRESQKMEALGTLAGGVAHDFNNIVATILGNVELARQDVGPRHPSLESLEEIGKAGRRAKDLVRQILAFGRRQVLERRVIALAPVVDESARLLRSTLPAGVTLRVECAPDAPAVHADAMQVEQVLLNLCANAWQSMLGQTQPAAIELSLAAHLASGASYSGPERRTQAGRVALRPGLYACLTVRDTGPGMDPATRSRIFEPFFTTKPVGKGTGLGLAVVHGIVQDHGASIAVHSAPGEGTTFRIYFPASPASPLPAQDTAPQAKPCAARTDHHEVVVLQGEGKSILYVDDDESIVILMTRLLEREGYRVSGYTDPREALAAARLQPDAFDLVVTDYNMPGMSGLEVVHELRKIRADLPVALASGYITEELRAQAPAAGVSELIYKPNTADELFQTIARLARARPGKAKAA